LAVTTGVEVAARMWANKVRVPVFLQIDLKLGSFKRRLRAFVQSRAWSLDGGVIGSCGRIPCHAKTVDVQVAVSGGHLELSLFGVWIVRLETRQEVGFDLLAQGTIWGHEDIFQKTFLGCGNIREPPTHLDELRLIDNRLNTA
jgi:hypothetical protein